jgi:hypothetical protein
MYHETYSEKHGKLKRKSFVLWGLESYSCHICLGHSATTHENNLTEKKKKVKYRTPIPGKVQRKRTRKKETRQVTVIAKRKQKRKKKRRKKPELTCNRRPPRDK